MATTTTPGFSYTVRVQQAMGSLLAGHSDGFFVSSLLEDRDRQLEDFLKYVQSDLAAPGGYIIAPARIGPSPTGAYGSTYASIDHTGRAYNSPGNYMLLGDTINTFVNAPTGGSVFIRVNNGDYAQFGGSAVVFRNGAGTDLLTANNTDVHVAGRPLSIDYQQPIYLRGYNDPNHALIVPVIGSYRQSAWSQDGPVLSGYSHVMLGTGSDNAWQLIAVANSAVGVRGKLAVGGVSTNDVNWDFETIVTYGGASGLAMRQRGRAWNDLTRRVVLYPGSDDFKVWHEGSGESFVIGPNASGIAFTSSAYIAVPALGGGNTMNLQVGGSWQIGYIVSSGHAKQNIRALKDTPDPDSGHNSPIFKMRPTRFNWKKASKHPETGHWRHDGVVNADELNTAFPNGVAGLIAEEVALVAPDAVLKADGPGASQHQIDPNNPPGEHLVHDEFPEGTVLGLDNDRLIAYLIDAVQYLKEEIDLVRKQNGNRPPVR